MQIQDAKDEQDFKNNLHKILAEKANSLIGSGLSGEGDQTTWPELPCRPL